MVGSLGVLRKGGTLGARPKFLAGDNRERNAYGILVFISWDTEYKSREVMLQLYK